MWRRFGLAAVRATSLSTARPTVVPRLTAPVRHMHLSPRELDHLRIAQAGQLAQRRLARGLKLNHPEAVALIAAQMLEMIRDGEPVAALMTKGQQLLGRRQVMPGVASLIGEVQVEGTFPDGTKLLTVHSPIAATDGDMSLALQGSFLPVPDLSVFGELQPDAAAPGTVTFGDGGIELNAGRRLIELAVVNSGDRPIQVGSHYHFLETNAALVFDRAAAYGMRLNVPAGSSVRFEPGDAKTVTLVDIAGAKNVVSGNRLINGVASPERLEETMARVVERGFGHAPAATPPAAARPLVLSRAEYGCHVRADDGRPRDAGRHGAGRAGRGGLHRLRRRVQVRRRQDAARGHGPELWGRPRRGPRPRRDERSDHRRRGGHRQGGHRHQGQPHRWRSARRATPT